jgi:hypothetical protein
VPKKGSGGAEGEGAKTGAKPKSEAPNQTGAGEKGTKEGAKNAKGANGAKGKGSDGGKKSSNKKGTSDNKDPLLEEFEKLKQSLNGPWGQASAVAALVLGAMVAGASIEDDQKITWQEFHNDVRLSSLCPLPCWTVFIS